MLDRTRNNFIYRLHSDRMDFTTGEMISPIETQNYFIVQVADTYSVKPSEVGAHIQRCDVELTYAGYGSLACSADGEGLLLNRGDCYLSLKGEEHSLSAEGGSRYRTVAFNVKDSSPESAMLAVLKRRFASPAARLFRAPGLDDEIADLTDLTEYGGEFSAEMSDACVTKMLAILLRGEKESVAGARPGDVPMPEITDYIDENLLRIGSLASLADVFGYSYGHLARLFRKRYGVNMREYYIARRMDYARRRLAEGATVTAVAEELGYCGPYDFSHAYKNRFGTSPRSEGNKGE